MWYVWCAQTLAPFFDGLSLIHPLPARGFDQIIVGRDIINAKDPKAAAQKYAKLAWAAYERQLGSASASTQSRL